MAHIRVETAPMFFKDEQRWSSAFTHFKGAS